MVCTNNPKLKNQSCDLYAPSPYTDYDSRDFRIDQCTLTTDANGVDNYDCSVAFSANSSFDDLPWKKEDTRRYTHQFEGQVSGGQQKVVKVTLHDNSPGMTR
jgi:hypothetical protein